MSAFHRVDDLRAMPARRLIDFALRLGAYKGIIRTLIEASQRDGNAEVAASATAPAAARRPTTGGDIRQNRTVDSDAHTLLTDPAFAGMFEPMKGAPDA
jgi:hypothetical protein